MDKPAIAIFLNAFWIHGQGMSGGDQMAIQIFHRIRTAFSAMHWFTSPDGKQAVQPLMGNAEFSVTPAFFDRLPIGLSYVLRTLAATVRLLNRHVDIIYSGSDFFPDVVPAWFYTRLHRKTRWVQCVFHIYPDWRARPGNKWVNWIAAYLQKGSLVLAKKADGIVNINQEVRQVLIEQGFDPARLAIITPGIDLEMIESVAPEAIGGERFDALFLGRLNPSKGIFDLPEIWRQVVAIHPNVRLGLIGGGSEEIRSQLQEVFAAAGVGNHVVLLGFVESARIYAMMKNARVFVFPSHEEGFGIAIVEALACGLSVVAWNLPIYAELFGDVITTVTQGDQTAFAQAVICALGKKPDSEKAKRCAQRYSWQDVSEAMRRWLIGGSVVVAWFEGQQV